MKNSILLKSLFLTVFVFCFKNVDAQLASDAPAPILNKTLVTTKQDSVKTLASEAPIVIQNSPKANKNNPTSDKIILPSESLISKPNAANSRKKQ